MSEQVQPITRESLRENVTDFEQSIERLYGLVDIDEPATYFRVRWDYEVKGRIDALELIDATPTGARKEERNGEFNQAQFIIRTHSDDGTVSEPRFEWLRTGFKKPGTPIVAHAKSLTEDYGYRALTVDALTEVMVDKASTLSDYIAILEQTDNRDFELPVTFASGLSRAAQRAMDGPSSTRSRGVDSETKEMMFGVISKLNTDHGSLSLQIQSKVVSRLLGPLRSYYDVIEEKADTELYAEKDEAMTALTSAFDEGHLANTPQIVHKVLSTPAVYEYPLGTDLLHAELAQHHYDNLRRQKIFSIQREDFIDDYMKYAIAGRMRDIELEPDVAELAALYIKNRPVRYLDPKKRSQDYTFLLRLADALPDKFGRQTPMVAVGNNNKKGAVDFEQARTLKVYEAFERVLDHFSSNPGSDDLAIDEQNVKSLEIIRILQRPFIVKDLVKVALADVTARSKKRF